MEGDSKWKPNEQGRASLVNNANDWRSTHEPDLRKRIIFAIVEKLKICFPKHSQNDINNTACKFEGKIYGMATDKADYLRKISEKIMVFDEKFKSVQSGSPVNGCNATPYPAAQALNQGESPPTLLPYTHTPTSQQQFHQNNIHESSIFSTQVPITVSPHQSLNIQMGEGVYSNPLTCSQRHIQGRQQLLPQPQSSNDMFQRPYMQQHAQHQHQNHQQSLLKQHVQQSFPQSSAHSSLTSSTQQDSQFLPRHQFPTQRVHSSHQQQMYVPNNIARFQQMAQQNNNLQNMHMQQQQHLCSHSNNASSFPSQQQQYMPHQSDNFNVYESSLFGTQGQEVGQSQPQMLQQYQQNIILPQHLDDTQRFQASGSFHQTLNIANQHSQPSQLQRAPPENPSMSQDSTDKMVSASGRDWQEETYQKIKTLKEKYLPVLSILLQKLSEKLQENDSLPQQKMQNEPMQKLRAGKLMLEVLIEFLNVARDSISERHRDMFSLYEEQILRFTKNHQTITRRPMQHQQSQSGHNQVHVSQSLDNDQMSSRLMPSHQNGFSSQTATCHNIGTSSQSLGWPFVAPSPSLGDLEKPISIESPLSYDYQLQTKRLKRSDIITSQTDSYKQFNSLESEADSTASSDSKSHKIEPGCVLLQEIKEINGSLVETVVNICNEVTSGTVVTCSYAPVALSDTLEAHYKSGHIIQPLSLLVPENYPYSPILLLETVPSDTSLHKYDDLSARTRSRFSLSMKEFSEPMSLKEIAQVWDVCARETMAEYAERHGGGTFSSKYGPWEPVLGAS